MQKLPPSLRTPRYIVWQNISQFFLSQLPSFALSNPSAYIFDRENFCCQWGSTIVLAEAYLRIFFNEYKYKQNSRHLTKSERLLLLPMLSASFRTFFCKTLYTKRIKDESKDKNGSLQTGNSHCRWKYHRMAGLIVDLLGFISFTSNKEQYLVL